MCNRSNSCQKLPGSHSSSIHSSLSCHSHYMSHINNGIHNSCTNYYSHSNNTIQSKHSSCNSNLFCIRQKLIL